MLHGLLRTPGNLELRKRKGVSRLTLNDVSLAGLVGDVERAMRSKMALFAQAIFGEVSEET